MKKLLKAVTIGDIKGIGIELLIKLWKTKRKTIGNFVLITNYNLLIKYLNVKKINLPIVRVLDFKNIQKITNNNFLVFDIDAINNDYNTYNSILNAYNLVINKKCSSIISLPLNKEKITNNIDKNFIGQTELFQKLDKKKYSNMFFYSNKIIISPLTTHIPLKKVSQILSDKKLIYQKIILINKTLINDFKIPNPKIAISGINPHAGEKGTIGNEEIKYLKPIIKKLSKKRINIQGPFSADSMFNKINRSLYDCFICAFHDQALIAFKIISEFEGVNYTGSLDIIRTSPDHGTAYNMVNTNKANIRSLYNSFKLADIIYKNRIKK